MAHRVGIDLGTTNSVIAFTEFGRQRCVKVEENELSSAVLPSCVAADGRGGWWIGSTARRTPGHAAEFKRYMGRDFAFPLGDRTLGPVELSAMVLGRLKDGFEARHGTVEGAVITVPAMFDEPQRRQTIEAGRLAGLNVLRVINEPSAAAIAYAQTDRPPGENALVIDWGGGTLDVSLVDCDSDVLDVVANYGDVRLGGRDVDAVLADALLARLRAAGHELELDDLLRAELAIEAEKIKIHLSRHPAWTEPVFLKSRRLFVEVEITREEFEASIAGLLHRVFAAAHETLRRRPAGALSPRDVSEVILVGGSCGIPALQRRVVEEFGRTPRATIDPMEVVALGAAYQAQYAESSTSARIVTVHSMTMHLGVKCVGPDALGRPQADRFSRIIEAGTKIPVRASETYRTTSDDQETIRVEVFETKDDVESVAGLEAWDAREIAGLPPGPAGSYPIRITFDYAVDQTLTVSVDVANGQIRQAWKPERLRDLEARRPAAQANVDLVLGRSEAALADLVRRADAALSGLPGARESRRHLDELRAALLAGDAAAALGAKSALLRAMFEEGVRMAG